MLAQHGQLHREEKLYRTELQQIFCQCRSHYCKLPHHLHASNNYNILAVIKTAPSLRIIGSVAYDKSDMSDKSAIGSEQHSIACNDYKPRCCCCLAVSSTMHERHANVSQTTSADKYEKVDWRTRSGSVIRAKTRPHNRRFTDVAVLGSTKPRIKCARLS